MDDHASPNPLLRRKSIAGPFMRASTGISAEHRPEVYANEMPEEAPTSASTAIPPLMRANTISGGGWFGGWFSRRSSISSTTGLPRSPDPASEDNYAHLAASAPQVLPPKVDSRDSLFNSLGGPTPSAPAAGKASAPETGNAPPPLKRRLSEVALKQQGRKSSFLGESISTSPTDSPAVIASSPPRPSILETDIRQGPIETDLFWLVLRDIGE